MKNLLLIGCIIAGFTAGLHIGKTNERELNSRQIHILSKELERFNNRTVFHHAEKVARITGTSLYQVLTGKLDIVPEE